MRLPFFDPPREDVAAVASDLIIRLGLHARDEALSSEAHHAGYFFGRDGRRVTRKLQELWRGPDLVLNRLIGEGAQVEFRQVEAHHRLGHEESDQTLLRIGPVVGLWPHRTSRTRPPS